MSYTYPVCFADTDAGGVVYHSKYLEVAERARSHMINQVGLTNADLQQQDVVFAVRRLTIEYLIPARLDDVIAVQTVIEQTGGARLQLLQELQVGDRTIAIINVMLGCITCAGNARRIPPHIRNILK